jgi:hypothetical protein
MRTFADMCEVCDGMVVQTLANVDQTTRSQVARERLLLIVIVRCMLLTPCVQLLTVTLFVCLPVDCRRNVAR